MQTRPLPEILQTLAMYESELTRGASEEEIGRMVSGKTASAIMEFMVCGDGEDGGDADLPQHYSNLKKIGTELAQKYLLRISPEVSHIVQAVQQLVATQPPRNDDDINQIMHVVSCMQDAVNQHAGRNIFANPWPADEDIELFENQLRDGGMTRDEVIARLEQRLVAERRPAFAGGVTAESEAAVLLLEAKIHELQQLEIAGGGGGDDSSNEDDDDSDGGPLKIAELTEEIETRLREGENGARESLTQEETATLEQTLAEIMQDGPITVADGADAMDDEDADIEGAAARKKRKKRPRQDAEVDGIGGGGGGGSGGGGGRGAGGAGAGARGAEA